MDWHKESFQDDVYLGGWAEGKRLPEVKKHLRECPECRKRMMGIARFMQEIDEGVKNMTPQDMDYCDKLAASAIKMLKDRLWFNKQMQEIFGKDYNPDTTTSY